MTDKETIKSLECCIAPTSECNKCPAKVYAEDNCFDLAKEKALDLINRTKGNEIHYRRKVQNQREIINALQNKIKWLQKENEKRDRAFNELIEVARLWREKYNNAKAENVRLNKEVDRLSQVVLYNDGITEMKITEAYKEFAERAKALKTWADTYGAEEEVVTIEDIDNLYKKLAGEQK